ncbi:cytidylyltransferase domain-containing protein [Prochlorococcus marinus]|uniref:acylneuraminate cytidylyltransferase family protein n=1 Tax=Prochlorococcus marinus TaxID=1219 RepID=UPI0039AFFD4E
MSEVVALIPARGGSKGLRNKNLKKLLAHSLVGWSIRFALKSNSFNRCIVTSDDQEIIKEAIKYGASAPFVRDPHLATDSATSSDVVIDAIERCKLKKDDILILLEPTSPFRRFEHLNTILDLIKSNDCNKVVSVYEAVSTNYIFQYKRITDSAACFLKPISTKLESFQSLRRQEITKSYFLDGTFYASKVKDFLDKPTFLSEGTGSVVTDLYSSFEIDSIDDFMLLESIFKNIGEPF